ncbi:hypothetical protein Gromo_00032 [Candidatus Gromoviella agglomerans]|nr:hypothetical protein Gromo_00032 [Candidatus Gromoviella agglomerans]
MIMTLADDLFDLNFCSVKLTVRLDKMTYCLICIKCC